MSFPKPHLFSSEDQHLGTLGRALGHPARISILRILEESGGLFVHEIVRLMPLHETTVSAHLKKLRQVGLIEVEEFGLLNRYTINAERIREMRDAQIEFAQSLLGIPEELQDLQAANRDEM